MEHILSGLRGRGRHQAEALEEGFRAALIQEVPEEGLDAVGFALHDIEEAGALRRQLPEAVQGEEDAGEGRAQVVGDHVQEPQPGFEAAPDLLVGPLQGQVLADEEAGAALDGLLEVAGALSQGVQAQPDHPGEQGEGGESQQDADIPALMPGG